MKKLLVLFALLFFATPAFAQLDDGCVVGEDGECIPVYDGYLKVKIDGLRMDQIEAFIGMIPGTVTGVKVTLRETVPTRDDGFDEPLPGFDSLYNWSK